MSNQLEVVSKDKGKIKKLTDEYIKSTYTRINDKISMEPNTGCHLWTGSVSSNSDKYKTPRIAINSRGQNVLRFIYIYILKKNLKHGDCILHKCDTPLCINIEHTYIGNSYRNYLDMVSRNRSKLKLKTIGHTDNTGSKNGMSKLDDDSVRFIRMNSSYLSVKEIASICECSQRTIYSVINNVVWKNIEVYL